MHIGELAERTGVPTGTLQHYEQEGMLRPNRGASGLQHYDESTVDHVLSVRNLIDAGLTSRLVRVVLDLDRADSQAPVGDCSRATAQSLRDELVSIDSRIECLQQSRSTVRAYLGQTSHADLIDEQVVPAA